MNRRYYELLAKAKLFYEQYQTHSFIAVQVTNVSITSELLARLILIQKNELLNSDSRLDSQFQYLNEVREKERTRPLHEVWKLVKMFYSDLEDMDPIWNEIMICRNEYLHSEYLPRPGSMWESRALRLVSILLSKSGISFEEFYPTDADRANEMIEELESNIESSVKQRMAECKKKFDNLENNDRETIISVGEMTCASRASQYSVVRTCPSCHRRGRLSGDSASIIGSEVNDDGIITDTYSVRSSKYHCWVCQLELFSNFEISVADLEGKFEYVDTTTVSERFGESMYEEYELERSFDAASAFMND